MSYTIELIELPCKEGLPVLRGISIPDHNQMGVLKK